MQQHDGSFMFELAISPSAEQSAIANLEDTEDRIRDVVEMGGGKVEQFFWTRREDGPRILLIVNGLDQPASLSVVRRLQSDARITVTDAVEVLTGEAVTKAEQAGDWTRASLEVGPAFGPGRGA